jgi:hypothetical protein
MDYQIHKESLPSPMDVEVQILSITIIGIGQIHGEFGFRVNPI